MKLPCKGETTNVSMMKGMYQNGDSTAPVAINLMPVSIAPNGAPNDGFQARRVIKKWMAFYNSDRPHSALDRQTPDDAYWAGLKDKKAA